MNTGDTTTSQEGVKLYAVGDIMLGDSPVSFGFGVGSLIKEHGPHFPFEQCRDRLQQADVLFGNLEAVLSTFDWTRTPFERKRLRGQPIAAEGLQAAGFDVLALANNHIMQHGREAAEETVEHLAEVNIETCGLENLEKGISNPVIITRNNLRFCFLAYNQRPRQYFLDPPIYVKADIETIERDITHWRDRVDCLVISLHWGDEFISYPASQQIHVAHRLVDLGASLILGHHPHVLQGIERYNGSIIAYSLGNFIFDMVDITLRTGMILECVVAPSGKIDYETTPIIMNEFFQPELSEDFGPSINREIRILSELINRTPDDEAYQRELHQLTQRYRRKDLLRYLRNTFRYRPRDLAANLAGVIGRRLRPLRS